MPAIRYYYHCVYLVVDHLPSTRCVDVRRRDGTYQRMPWLGMICEAAMDSLPGLGPAKIRAVAVTDGDGLSHCLWRDLRKEQHTLGWRCQRADGTQGVYGVVDRTSWPIIVGRHGRIGVPSLKVVRRG